MPQLPRSMAMAVTTATLLSVSLACAATPKLHKAARKGNVQGVEAMLAAGVHPDSPPNRRRTALHEAASEGHVEVCERLLDAGADVDARDKSRRTPLLVATMRRQPEVVALLIARGADPDLRDKDRRTALHAAAYERQPEIARMLLAAGASPNLRDENMQTPLYRAARQRQTEIAWLLLDHGADPNVPDERGRTPLLEAVDERRVELTRRLLEAGARPDAGDHDGRTPLLHAVEDRQHELVGLLLAAGATADAVDPNGEPLLIRAVRNRDHGTAAQLLDAGAPVDARNRNGERALHIAQAQQDVRLVELLLERGADPASRSQELAGVLVEDPMAYAAEHGYLGLAAAYVKGSAALAARRTREAVSGAGPDEDVDADDDDDDERASRRASRKAARRAARQPNTLHAAAPPPTPTTPSRTAPASAPRPGPDPHYSRRVAVVIGIDDYRHWPGLEGASRDARRVAATLRAQGFDEVVEVYDGEATRRRLLTVLGSDLARRTDDDSLAVIYFAGHGQTETLPSGEKRGYLIPVDADREQVFATGISMETLRELSNRLPARQVYYAMDSCYSGLGFTRGITRVRRDRPDYVKQLTSQRAVQMITAGAENEQVAERGSLGLFTTYFLRALSGEADADDDGFVTGSEIGSWVKPQVQNASGRRQTPQFGALEGAGDVAFRVR